MHKIYSYANKTSYHITTFIDFNIQQISINDFIITNNIQKFCVQSGEIFIVDKKKYFIFKSTEITFLYESQKNKKQILFYQQSKEKIKTNKKNHYQSILLLSLFIFYMTQLLSVDSSL